MTNLKEDLYGKLTLTAVVRPAPQVQTRPTIIQNFDGIVSLITVKNGKMLKVEQPSIALAKKFCLEVLGKEPIVFQKGWIQGHNGHPVEIEEEEKN